MENQETNPKAKEIPPKEILKELLQFGSYYSIPDFPKEKGNGKESSKK